MLRKLAAATLSFWFGLATPLLAQGVDVVTTPPIVFPGVDGGRGFVALEATQIFWDDFGTGTLDTTNRWNTPTTGGGGNAVAATNAVGATVLSSGTSANGYSLLTTKATFAGRNPGYITGQWQVNVPFPSITGAYGFWGFFIAPGTPTAAAPLTNAVGFAIDAFGKLRAQTWGSGAINVNIDLSVVQSAPQLCNCATTITDSAVHKYQISFRGDNILWWVDGKLVARVLTGAGGPDVNTLSTGALTVVGTSGIGSALAIQLNQVTLGDTSRNNTRLCDATFGWRCATVTAAGALTQSADPCAYATKSSVAINITTATTTSLVAASGTTTVYVCGFSLTISPAGTTADTIQFEYGTGAACVTTQTVLTGTFGNGDLTTAAAVTPISYGGSGQTVFQSIASNAICAVSAGNAVSIQGVMTYVQQ